MMDGLEDFMNNPLYASETANFYNLMNTKYPNLYKNTFLKFFCMQGLQNTLEYDYHMSINGNQQIYDSSFDLSEEYSNTKCQ